MTLPIVAVFIAGYLLIALEHFLKINKSATALLTGVACWILCVSGTAAGGDGPRILLDNLAGIADVLFFLMGAMTIVEIIDAHNGFDAVASLLASGGRRRLLWATGLAAFFLSAVLNNLTTTIVLMSILSKVLTKREDLLPFAGVVVIAVNAGGAWTPIGDVTTTMLWIGGQVTSLSIIKALLLPSLVCAAVPLVWLSLQMRGSEGLLEKIPVERPPARVQEGGRLVFFLGAGSLLTVPVFRNLTGLPSFVGMMFGLALVWVATEILHRKSDPERRQAHSVAAALQRIDMQTVLFFLGLLLAVAALHAAGALAVAAQWLDRTVGNRDAVALAAGLLSAIVDNVPLTAAAMKMYPLAQVPTNHHFWSFLSYCVGAGGSILVIGSAAGVAAMGMAKMDFFWYLRRITPMALAGYVAGAGVYLLQMGLFK